MMITSGIKAQYTMGTTGMMNIPTAELEKGDKFYITSIVVTGPGNKKKQIASINVVLI